MKIIRNYEQNIQEFQENVKRINLKLIGLEEGEKTNGIENLFSKTIENFLKFYNEMYMHVLKTFRTPSGQEKKNTPWYNMTKNDKKIRMKKEF